MAKESPTMQDERAPKSAVDEQEMVMAKSKSLTGKKISFSGSATGPSSNDTGKQPGGKTSTKLAIKKGRKKRS